MKDRRMTELQKIEEYEGAMEVLYHALKKAVKNPEQKDHHLNIPYNICRYQETIKFIRDYPRWYHESYDLPLLKKEMKDLSESDLKDWLIELLSVRGSLSGIKDDIGS